MAVLCSSDPWPPKFTLPDLRPSVPHTQDLPAELQPGAGPTPTSYGTASLHSHPTRCADPGATGDPPARIYAECMGKQQAIFAVSGFNSALLSRLLRQQDSNKDRHCPLSTQMNICLQWELSANTKVKAVYPSISYPNCRFRIYLNSLQTYRYTVCSTVSRVQ